jgi:hypothetical protein
VVVTPAAAVTQPSASLGLKGTIGLKLKGLSPVLKADFTAIARALSSFSVVSRLMEEEGIFYFFKHTESGHTLLTKSDAALQYLAIGAPAQDANELGGRPASSYLPVSGTAQNANEVGGQSPPFVHGDGGLSSGAATLSGGPKSQKLLTTAGIEVDAVINGNGFPSVTIDNSTGVSIPAVLDQGGTDGDSTLGPGPNSLTLSPQNGIDQLHLQTFPAGSFNHIVTLIISINFNAAQGSSSFAGQLIDGGG